MNTYISIIFGCAIVCGLLVSPKVNAQQFENYKQTIPEETISIDMV